MGRVDRIDAAVFTVLDVGHIVDADGMRRPTVVIDAADAPEVADLARVHVVEGVGDIHTEAVRFDDLIVLGIRMTVPVRATFAIVFDARHHQSLLDDVIEHESLVIAHTDPHLATVEQPAWLAVDIDGRTFAAQIAQR